MRNLTGPLACWALSSLLSVPAARAASVAEPDAYAAKPAPANPKPPPFAEAKGFGTALDPYKDQLSGEERATFQRFAEELLGGAGGAIIKRGHAALSALQKKLRGDFAMPPGDDDFVELFTYTIPNDPLLMLGTAKSYVGPVTTPPRLKKGAFETKPAKPPAVPGATVQVVQDEDDWIFNDPAKICTRGLSYGLEMRSLYADLENFPVSDGTSPRNNIILTQIERTPNPIILAESIQDEPAPQNGAQPLAPEGETANDTDGRPFPELRNKDMPLAQFLPQLKKHLAKDREPVIVILSEITALSSLVPGQRKKCVEAGGKFREARWTGGGDLSLFSCEVDQDKEHGLGARLLTGGASYFKALSLYAEDANTGLGTEVELGVGQIRAVLRTYKNDDYFGPQITWDEAGRPMQLDFVLPASVAAKYGEYDVFEWHEDGKLKFLGHRRGDKKAGTELSWYASGALAGEVRFDDQGRPTSYKEWYENRRAAEDTVLVDGEMNGTRRWWHQNGQPAGELAYSRGKPTGPFLLWYDDGRVGTRGSFKNGQLDGKLTWSFEDGGTLYEGTFKNGAPDGTHKLYKTDGRLISEKAYKQGEPEGSWQTFNRDGKIMADSTFTKGQKTGRSVLNYPDGQVFVELPFQDGKIEGPQKAYFKDGQLASTCLYEQDRLVSFVRYFPTGEVQLEGKIEDVEAGKGEFSALTKEGEKTLTCRIDDRVTKDCKFFGANGDELSLPSEAELAKKAKSVDKKPLVWQPSKCGGADKQLNVDTVADGQGKEIFLNFSVQGDCAPGLAWRLSCVLAVEKDRIESLSPCQMEAYTDTESDLERIIEQMGEPVVH